jgi:hypothetical protein
MKQARPRQGRIAWSIRRIGFDHNPMRRCADRVQAVVRAGLVAVFLTSAPIVITHVAYETYASGLRAGREQAAAWHPVPARVLHATPLVAAWASPTRPPWRLSVRWAKLDGASQIGQITRAVGAKAGSTVTVWTDKQGRLAHAPLSRAQVADQVIRAAVATLLVLALMLATVGWVVSLILDRRRLASWEADWAVVEPQWTHRR